MSTHDCSISSLENYIDKTYDELSTANNIQNAISNDTNDSDTNDSNMSTPLLHHVKNVNNVDVVHANVIQSPGPLELYSTPQSILGMYSKKRKTISPTIGMSDLDDLDEKDSAVKTIAEAVFNVVVGDVSKLFHDQASKLAALESELSAKIENELMRDAEEENTTSEIRSLQEDVTRLQDQLKIAIGRITRAEKERDDMREELLQLEARMMRDNLMFYNIEEPAEEPTHNCELTLKTFLTKEMKIRDVDMEKINFDRVHRIGKKVGNKKRPIVAKFNPADGKRIVMDHVKNLDKVKKYGVNDQLPRELEERKKKLLPAFKEARKDNKQPKWQLDKLVIGKNVKKAHKDKVLDINSDTTHMAASMTAKHAPPKSYGGSSFRGHNVNVAHQDDIIPALHVLYSDERVARAQHNVYAYRLENGTEHCEDDGEWGGGRVLLQLLREHNITNRLVCVTRWYGGKHLGRARFDYIREAGSMSLGLG
jgi:hypothetical protein